MENRQLKGDCMTPKEARSWLKSYINAKGREVALDRRWWFRFKQKNKETFGVFKIHSIESKMCEISRGDLNDYFKILKDELKEINNMKCNPELVLNMNESGFFKRPDYNSTRNCVCFPNCSVKPTFREKTIETTFLWCAAVTLTVKTLKPMLISTINNPPKEIIDSPLGKKFLWAKTKKGYLNIKTMMIWINQILVPYVNMIRQMYGDMSLNAILIFDFGLSSHKSEIVLNLLNSYGIRCINYPPNCTHLVKCLDFCFFGIMKKEYKLVESTLFSKDKKKCTEN